MAPNEIVRHNSSIPFKDVCHQNEGKRVPDNRWRHQISRQDTKFSRLEGSRASKH